MIPVIDSLHVTRLQQQRTKVNIKKQYFLGKNLADTHINGEVFDLA